MTPFQKAVLASLAFTSFGLGACSKQTELSEDAGQPASEAAASITPSPTAISPADATLQASDTTMKTIADVAASQSQFSTLISAAKAAGLDVELAAPGPITVFAPTDAAFAALPAGKLEALMKPENKSQLEDLLKHHILSGKVTSSDLQGTTTETAMNGTLAIDASNPAQMMVADAHIVGPEITALNGVIHTVDKVLIPAT